MSDIYNEPLNVHNYHKEYQKLINLYQNIKRPSIFVKYYNINKNHSEYNQTLKSTFDNFSNNNILYDIYDLTPVFTFGPIYNNVTINTSTKGKIIEGSSTIVVYTIDSINENDLITFYEPIKSNEIFKIINPRLIVNAYHSDNKIKWFEVDLEYAPITSLDGLKIYNNYVYDLRQEKYLSKKSYTENINKLKKCKNIINNLKNYYDSINDYYVVDGYVLDITNNIIIYFKDYLKNNNFRIFDELKKPYGYLSIYEISSLNFDINNCEFTDINYYNFNGYYWFNREKYTNNIETCLYWTYQLYLELINGFTTD